jgi:hypothetical protein
MNPVRCGLMLLDFFPGVFMCLQVNFKNSSLARFTVDVYKSFVLLYNTVRTLDFLESY